MAPLLGFLLGFVGSIPVAGPISLLVLAEGVRGRFERALAVAVGGAVVEALYALLAFWGVSRMLERWPAVLPVSRGVGAVVLLGLGSAMLRSRPPAEGDEGAPEDGRRRGLRAVLLGASITAINPTLLVTWTAAVTTLSSSGVLASSMTSAVPFAVGVALGILAWFATLLALVRRYRERFRRERLGQVVRWLGGALIALGLFFVWTLVRPLSS